MPFFKISHSATKEDSNNEKELKETGEEIFASSKFSVEVTT